MTLMEKDKDKEHSPPSSTYSTKEKGVPGKVSPQSCVSQKKLYVAENELSSLSSQLTSSKTHLESSHKEIRQLRETVLKGEKGKRVMERRVKSIENALSEMQSFIQAAKVKNMDSSKAKDIYENLNNVVKELLENPDPTKQAIEVELVIDELNVLREEIRQIQQQHATVVSERDSVNKKLQHEQNWVDKLRQKEENLTRTLDEKNEQLSSVKHELQLRERLLSDKERAFQIKKGELEEEIKTLKKRHKTMLSGEKCGHEGLLTEVDQLRNQLQVARNTVQYKEQELDKLVKEKITVEEKLKNSNTEKLHNEILELNIANSRLQGQLQGTNGETEETSHAEERSNLLGVISQNKVDLEELNRKLYQSELRSETLVTAIEELKSQHENERERYKRDLGDFHERVTTQKEQLSRSLKELEDLKIKYLETKKQKELAEEEAIRLGERVTQFRDTNNLESDKIGRLEKDLDRKTEALATLTEKCKTTEAKVHEQEIEISQLNRSVLALEQTKTTLQLKYSDLLQKYDREKEHFESVKQKLRTRAKNYKLQYEKENSALINKSVVLEEETALLKLHVNKEETWRKTAEQSYAQWRSRTRDLETSCAAYEEEVRMQKSEMHALNCTLAARHDEIAALTAELQHVTRTQQHYERMYRTLELKSRADTSREQVASSVGNITHPILGGNVLTSTPIRPNSQPVEAPPEQAPLEQVPERDDLSDRSRLTLEEEGLNLDDPSKPEMFEELTVTPSLLDMLSPIISSTFTQSDTAQSYTTQSLQLSRSGVSSPATDQQFGQQLSSLPEKQCQKLSSLATEDCRISSVSSAVSTAYTDSCDDAFFKVTQNLQNLQNLQNRNSECSESTIGGSTRSFSELGNKSEDSPCETSSNSSSDSSLLGHYYKHLSRKGQVLESSSPVNEVPKQSDLSLVPHYSNSS
ncbi:hypothetical protein ACHWQZ_G015776 [Mnemiopsis leidyi]